MVELGEANSRMKDYFDIAELARIRDFNGEVLSRAIVETFERRKTEIPAVPAGLTGRFGLEPAKQRQWGAFVSKGRLHANAGFESWVLRVAAFAGPVLSALARGDSFRGKWPAGGPWQ